MTEMDKKKKINKYSWSCSHNLQNVRELSNTVNLNLAAEIKPFFYPEMHFIAELAEEDGSGEQNRTFVFNEEGHTFGNALRSIIVTYPDVTFCGYTVPHPAESKMHFRIQTNGPRAIDVLRRGIEHLEKVCGHIKLVFEDKVEKFKLDPFVKHEDCKT